MTVSTIVRDQSAKRRKPQPTMSDSDQEAMWLLNERWQPQDTHRARMERQWATNLAYILGNQWGRWNETAWAYSRDSQRQKGRQVREQRNFMRAYAERFVANMTAFEPNWFGVPNSQDVEDEQAANMSTSVAKHYWRALKMVGKRQRLAMYAACTGTGFLKVQWNPRAGRKFRDVDVDPETGEVRVRADGRPMMRDYHEGEVETTVPSPFTVFVDPSAEDEDDPEWIMEVTLRTHAWASRQWPEKRQYFTRADGSMLTSLRQQQSVVDASGFGLSATTSEGLDGVEDRVVVREYWQRPTPEFEEGRLIIAVGDVIVHDDVNPTPNGDLPYKAFRETLIPGSYWGQPMLDNLRGLQRTYNRIRSTRLSHLYRLGMFAKVIWPDALGEPESHFVAGVGEVIKAGGGMSDQIRYLEPPSMPNDAENEAELCMRDLDEITNTHGAERGKYQGKMSGAAINLLWEASQQNRIPTLERMKEVLDWWGTTVVSLFQEHADEDRVIKIRGETGRWEINSFRGADLRGNTDVEIDFDSMVPRSRQLTINEWTQLSQSGFVRPDNPEDVDNFRAAMRFSKSEDLVERADLHRQLAMHEQSLMLHGEPMQEVKWYHNHDVHYREHTRFLNSAEAGRLTPEQRLELESHVEMHLQAAMPVAGATAQPPPQSMGAEQVPTE